MEGSARWEILMEARKTPRLELKGITKRFPGVLANDNVSFSVMPGEIHALLGENGAGKSTLVKMIYGIMQPDGGEISWNVPADFTAIGLHDPVDHLHQRRLSRAVLTQKRMNFAWHHRKADIVVGQHAGKTLGYPLELQPRCFPSFHEYFPPRRPLHVQYRQQPRPERKAKTTLLKERDSGFYTIMTPRRGPFVPVRLPPPVRTDSASPKYKAISPSSPVFL